MNEIAEMLKIKNRDNYTQKPLTTCACFTLGNPLREKTKLEGEVSLFSLLLNGNMQVRMKRYYLWSYQRPVTCKDSTIG